jgi:GNAT superfamily N-acetyltransferase
MENANYEWHPGDWVSKSSPLLNAMADLYSHHYGFWSANHASRPGRRVKLSPDKIRNYLTVKDSHVSLAYFDNQLIGYAIVIHTNIPKFGVVSWVTQLVVHHDYRNQGVAKQLLTIWSFSDNMAWGIITANPYAVRALEKSTRRRCDPKRISKNKRRLVNLGIRLKTYVTKNTSVIVDASGSRIDTDFPIDHSSLPHMLANVTNQDVEWLLGEALHKKSVLPKKPTNVTRKPLGLFVQNTVFCDFLCKAIGGYKRGLGVVRLYLWRSNTIQLV